jgi:hypothetical protein
MGPGTGMGVVSLGELTFTPITVPSGLSINGIIHPEFDRQATVCTTSRELE